jgi:HEXXH motif-containing protein
MRSIDPPRDLTVPEPGSRTMRELLSRSIGRLMEDAPSLLSEAAREASASGFRAWASAVAQEPGAAASLLRRPHLGGLVRTLRSAQGEVRSRLLIELLSTFAYEMAVSGAPVARLRVERLPTRLLALGARLALDVSRDVTRATFAPGEVIFEGAHGPVTIATRDPYVVIEGPLLLALEDNNPLASVEAHPDKRGNVVNLGGKSVEVWLDALREALRIVRDFVPELRVEMNECVEVIVPVGFDPEKHLSASYREVVGTLYVSLHPEVMTMAEALVHELSHTKLNLLFDVDPVLENAFEPLYVSPVRPDPRPLHGVLLAVHAFSAVLRLYDRMLAHDHPAARTERFRARMSALQRGNQEGLSVLSSHAHPTPMGRELLAEMQRWGERFRVELGEARLGGSP